MEKIHVYRFISDKRYMAEKGWFLYFLLERNGKDLTFRIQNFKTLEEMGTTTVQSTIVENHGAFCESVRVMSPDGWHTLYANHWLPEGKRVSELPQKIQEKIMASIDRDIKFREKNPQYDKSSIMTKEDKKGNISTHTIKELSQEELSQFK